MKALNDDLQMRSDWLFPICSGPERLKDDDGRKAHPTQKPEALLHRVLLATTNPGDVVLDPFFGTGTTGAVAKRLGRRWHRHRARSRLRGGRARSASPACSRCRRRRWKRPRSKRAEPRVPFGTIIELGILEPGHHADRRARARIRAEVKADGTLAVAGQPGLDPPPRRRACRARAACNGWTFWHFEAEGQRKPIDALREQAKRQLGLSSVLSAIAAE